ncbi:DUF5067 domain-containing protein [Fructobacillus tropaeoli]|uniref:Phage protein n=1 Tax=Fructobacillus tropaeoli TaxID=709323 RepID=A0A3F3HCU0_9LACO|nr:DUF5067 domain-containing protein [Fructobacillus tropaeoli]GAP04790.1 phage protein [Fructobacillus tropaeoli]GIC70940.1 DUF5067 domain-containing protein [Fructobacillus tropaeoli]CAK1253307.1 hypothetical protein R53137_KAKDMLNK_01474 [Fructobacillus tropaeoli]
MFKNKKRFVSIFGFAIVAVTTFAIVISTTSSKNKDTADSRSEAKSSSKSSSSDDSKFDGYTNTDSSNGWWLNDSTFKAGNLRFDFGKSEVVTGTDKSKILVIHAKMSNVSQKNIDSVEIYPDAIWAKQKSDNQEVDLTNVDNKLPENSAAFQEAQNFHKQLLPGQSTEVVINFELVNDSPVTVHFVGADVGQELGQKTFTIKK